MAAIAILACIERGLSNGLIESVNTKIRWRQHRAAGHAATGWHLGYAMPRAAAVPDQVWTDPLPVLWFATSAQ